MTDLIIAYTNKDKIRLWIEALGSMYSLRFFDNIDIVLSKKKQYDDNVLLILDASLIYGAEEQLALLSKRIDKILIIGEGISPNQQIQFIHKGALGYSDISIDEKLIVRAIEGILNNEIWLERHLIPLMLKDVVAKNGSSLNYEGLNKTGEIFTILTPREIEVTELVYSGEANTAIATTLKISNRTVKSHLSAIYRKLNVLDRFQLVVLLKDLHVNHLSSENSFFEGNS